MTTRQELIEMLRVAGEAPRDAETYGGQHITRTIEGKQVEVWRSGRGRSSYGKHNPIFKALVDGKPVLNGWSMGKSEALPHLLSRVSEKHIAEMKAQAQRSAEALERMTRAQAEKEAFERPARERAMVLMGNIKGQMFQEFALQFTKQECVQFLRDASNRLEEL